MAGMRRTALFAVLSLLWGAFVFAAFVVWSIVSGRARTETSTLYIGDSEMPLYTMTVTELSPSEFKVWAFLLTAGIAAVLVWCIRRSAHQSSAG
jgi:hypothetical protein